MFDHFCLVLHGALKDNWLNAVAEHKPPPCMVLEGFNQMIEQWKRGTFLHLDAHQEINAHMMPSPDNVHLHYAHQ